MKLSDTRSTGVGRSPVLTVLAAFLWCGAGALVSAAEGPSVGKAVSAAGTLLERTGKAWRVVPPKSEVTSGQYLLSLPGSRGEVATKDGAVQLSLWGNLPVFYDFPLLESAVVLQNEAGVDLEFVLVRGRVVLTKLKGQKPARVRVKFFDNSYDLVLSENGSEVALELYGRWSSGVPFARNQKEAPTQVLFIYAVKGSADLKIGNEQFLMAAPASYRWDNIVGREAIPRKAAPLPAWTSPKSSGPEAEAMRAAVKKLQAQLAETPVSKAVSADLSASNPATRELAVYSAAALDDLGTLIGALANLRFADERESAIHALRHWIGAATMQGPEQVAGQDMKLFQFLTKQRQYSEREAESVLQLLHGFRDSDRDRPETYEYLIEYLHHSKLPIRELARWYLYRWVHAGRKIAYNPADPLSVERGYKEWKNLIPDGQLPPRNKPEK